MEYGSLELANTIHEWRRGLGGHLSAFTVLSVADSMFIWDITLRDPQIMVFKIRELFVSVLCMFMNPNATDKVLLERKFII